MSCQYAGECCQVAYFALLGLHYQYAEHLTPVQFFFPFILLVEICLHFF